MKVDYDPTMKNVRAIVGTGQQSDANLRRDMNALVRQVKNLA